MSFTMTYDERNRNNIDKLAPNTKVAAYKFYQYCLDHGVDILIYETIRTIEKQKENIANGVSWTMKSYHLVGQAFDFVPIVNGKDVWERSAYLQSPYKEAIDFAKSIGFEWGGEWKEQDNPHLQFTYKGYNTDKTLDAPTEQPQPTQAAQPTAGGIIGVVRVKVDGLNIRTGAGTDYRVIDKAVKGRAYNVTANVKDWHEIILDNEGHKGWVFGSNGNYLELLR